MNTKPTKITRKQYQDAFFFINGSNADHYIIWIDEYGIEKDLWVGRDESSLKNTASSVGRDGIQKIKGQYYTDENGYTATADGYVFSTSSAWNNLDIEALAEGRIEWR